MPTLDELNTRPIISATPDSADLIPFYDVSEFGNGAVKKTTVSALFAGAGLDDVIFLEPGTTGLTGGTATDLDSIATVDLDAGRMIGFTSQGVLYIYQLIASTDAESSPLKVRPDDYAASTNEKVWLLVGLRTSSINVNGFTLTGTAGQLSIDSAQLTDAREYLAADVDGVLPVVPYYVDLTAANAALDSGDFWWDTTLNKLRQATA